MRRTSTLLATASGVALLAAALAGPAAAQSAAATAGAPSQSAASAQSVESGTPTTVDQIVVTAQKRVQNLQDVPIVVTTINRQLLQDAGVQDIRDLQTVTPGLLVTSTTSEGTTTARIRGIGTVGDNVGLESSVGVVIDGVYRPRNGVGFGDLGDVDRIEVLKGPQGTLFGKSTSAGVINVLTAQPSFDFGVHTEFTAGNYSQVGGSVSMTGPLIADKLAGSLYFADRERDGFNRVITAPGPNTLTRDQDRDFFILRGQLLYLPTDDLSVRVIADYSHRNERCCGAVQIRSEGSGPPPVGETAGIIHALGGAGGGEALDPNPFARTEYANRQDVQDIVDRGVSAEVNYKLHALGDANFTSITAFRDWKLVQGGDTDFTTADLLYRPGTDANSDEFQTFSEEARLSGKLGRLDYTVGAFYSHEHLRSNFNLLFGPQFVPYLSLLFSNGASPTFLQGNFGANLTPNTGDVDRYRQDDDTFAVFTNDTFHITDKLELNAGVRFTHDDKSLDSLQTNTNGGSLCSAVARAGAVLGGAVAGQIQPVTCLPILSPGFNNFSNSQQRTEDEFSGTAKLSYRFNPELMVYGSYARGYKAGGFNLDRVQCIIGAPGCAPGTAQTLQPVTNTSFPGEFVDSFELGAKSTLLGRTLLLNGTLFRQEYSNFQLNTFNGLVFVVVPVPSVVSQGLDTDFVWLPMRDLSFQGGLTIADTRFQPEDLAAFAAGGLPPGPSGYQGSRGSRLPLAPLYSASFSATYSHDLFGDFRARGNLGVKFSSAYNTGSDLDPGKRQGDYALVNARIAFFPRDERYSVEFWAENLFDKDYRQVVFDAPFQNAPTNSTGVLDAFLGQPRTWGVTLRAKY